MNSDDVSGDTDEDDAGESKWLPTALSPDLPPYLALLEQLERHVTDGHLQRGDRLPAHRFLANRLGVSIATVSKAYHEARRRGLVVGERGRGTFVNSLTGITAAAQGAAGASIVNIGYNFAPAVGQRSAIARTISEALTPDPDEKLLSYRSHQGLREHRVEMARWIARFDLDIDPDLIIITNGAQHALSLAASFLRQSNDEPIMVEELVYAGFKALSSSARFPVLPIKMDAEGLLPEDLDRTMTETGARVLYATPTLQSPMAGSLSGARRAEIAAILERRDGYLIEDDVFNFLPRTPVRPITALIPERSVYIGSLSKVLELGFRVGYMSVPARFLDAANLVMRATAWTTSPLLAETGSRLIHSGELDRIAAAVRAESTARRQVYAEIFAEYGAKPDPDDGGYHVWLSLPRESNPVDLFAAARAAGILLTPPGFAATHAVEEHGVRICLGSVENRDILVDALQRLKMLIARPQQQHFLIT